MRSLLHIIFLFTVLPVSHAQDENWDDWGADEWADDESGLQWSGFVEAAAGSRWEEDAQLARQQTLGDLRLRIETDWTTEKLSVGFKADAWYDQYLDDLDGEVRDLTLAFSPVGNVDVRVGRQILTWGTGDLLFLNDLFPKDWVSFFSGRDDEYLKAPSNAVRATWYTDAINVDFAWTPVFEADNYLTGERFSFFTALAGRRIAPDPPLAAVKPDKQLENGEFALRLFKTIAGNEYALYAYRGYFHQPTALNDALQPTFAPLTALGGSLRRPLGAGLFNAEAVYYASRDDRSGRDPRMPNDQVRILLGYEREAVTNLTIGFQYYVENTRDYDALISNSPAPDFEADEYRQVLTSRLTYRMQQEKLTLSLFVFYSPTDQDYYARPVVNYRHSDRWSFAGGANIFGGDSVHTFFKQFADNSNLYVRARFHY